MKLVIPAVLVLAMAVGGVLWFKSDQSAVTKNETVLKPTAIPADKEISWKNNLYTYAAKRLSGSYTAKLIDNLPGKLSSAELMQKNGCMTGINGGFYDTKDRHLGLEISDGQQISPAKESDLFNGVIFVDTQERLQIGRISQKEEAWRQAGQTGPMLIEAGQIIKLQLVSDKSARRMVVADLGADNGMALIAVTQKNAQLDGPYLADLPAVVAKIGQQEGWPPIRSAINLDGGSASAMYADNIAISEWQPVGSWWCIYSNNPMIKLTK